MPEPEATLTGLSVCVTRPEPEASRLANLIQRRGGQAIVMSAMKIVAVSDVLSRMEQALTDVDVAIFVSRNAVRVAMDVITSPLKQTLAHLPIAAIGSSTAQTLAEQGLSPSILPVSDKFTSEALLASPDLQQIQDKRFIIFKGLGGRTLLADTLQSRGAKVSCCDLYERQLPTFFDRNNFSKLSKSTHILLCSSVQIMHNLLELAGAEYETIVKNTPLLVASSRIYREAISQGFQSDVIVARNATDQAMIDRLLEWRAQEK